VRRLGADTDEKADVRYISTTNKNIYNDESVKFRPDLFERLANTIIYLPPLRERLDDINLLRDYFIEQYEKISRRQTTFRRKFLGRYPKIIIGLGISGSCRRLFVICY
jgi:transcriptional regulator with PAS, ATPase and Fis domain